MRFSTPAADRLRAAIEEAGGIEVFAIGWLDVRGDVMDIEVHCRGNRQAVPALLSRPKPGQVVIHNHPSGVLEASEADMMLASKYGEDGVGVIIVNNEVTRDLWVVEPHRIQRTPVKMAEVEHFFRVRLPEILPDAEIRESQIGMALKVAEAFNGGQVAMLEAGTGTGKSLAYLVPAILWARANETKVAVATYTITLQEQLLASDLKLLAQAGLEFTPALLKGRGNYLCRRQLADAMKDEARMASQGGVLRDVAAWAETAMEGSTSDLTLNLGPDLWDELHSDHDRSLRAKCAHFDDCFYYRARRRAAAADVLIVNHHLVLADLALKASTGGDGVLPRFDRLILDEGHHIEDAATSLFREQLSAESITRATGPLLSTKKRTGTLDRLLKAFPDSEPIRAQVAAVREPLRQLHGAARDWMEQLAGDLLSAETTLRLTDEVVHSESWMQLGHATLTDAQRRLDRVARTLSKLEMLLREVPQNKREEHAGAVFALARGVRRLEGHGQLVARFLAEGPEEVRWMERTKSRDGTPRARLAIAPVDVGPTIRDRVLDALDTVVMTSATLTVAGRFDYLRRSLALDDDFVVEQGVFDSPFDYATQAMVGIPRDVPLPDQPMYEDRVAELTIAAIRVSRGGVFVLCTSYRMVDLLYDRAQAELDGVVLLRQGHQSRRHLLDRFRASGNAVLFGTDSFWEGVNVKGEGLRLVIIPRLPFRVPTHPVEQARIERLQRIGRDPFRSDSLPRAALRLRQGSGRLIRTTADRGAVLILDRRIVERRYGAAFLQSLPPMRRVTGRWEQVERQLRLMLDR